MRYSINHTFLRFWFLGLFFLPMMFCSVAYSHSLSTLKSSTQKLIELSTITKGTSLTEIQLQQAIELAKIRQQALLKILDQPKAIKPFLLPSSLIATFPAAVQTYLEKEVNALEGKLEIRAQSIPDQQETLQYVLLQGNKIYYLHFFDKIPSHLKTDAVIRINHAIQFSNTATVSELVLSSQELIIVKPATALPLSLGPQKTITFLVNFSDGPNNRPWTPAFITNLMYTDINRMFYESSYQQTTLVGQTVGWYVLQVASTNPCSTLPDLVSKQADQAATNAGINLSLFSRKVYIFPKTSQCSWAGLGVVGGSKTRSWINGAASTVRTPGHELGHNFGIHHSQLLTCSSSPIGGTCTRATYGDGTDIMGAGRQTHFNAFQKDVLGWLNYLNSPPITLVTASGTYKIDPYETLNKNPKALKVLKRAGTTDYYYLEYRQGIGFDAELAACGTNCDYTRGVVFHQGNTVSTNSSDLLDMSWTNKAAGKVALLPGQSWSDPAAPNGGVTFNVVAVDATGATVRITFGSASKQ